MPNLTWVVKHKHPKEAILRKFLPQLNSEDPRSAKEQINATYNNAWFPFAGFAMYSDAITYQEESPCMLRFEAKLRNETIRYYDNGWVAIMQLDGSFEISTVIRSAK